MKQGLLLFLILLLGACATPRSQTLQFAKNVDFSPEDKVASKLVYFYLDEYESIVYLSYDANDFASSMARYKSGDFRVFASRVYEGPKWLVLKPGMINLAYFKGGFTTAITSRLFTPGYYHIVKKNNSIEIENDLKPNIDATVLQGYGLK